MAKWMVIPVFNEKGGRLWRDDELREYAAWRREGGYCFLKQKKSLGRKRTVIGVQGGGLSFRPWWSVTLLFAVQ
jgi:hypothetical protein